MVSDIFENITVRVESWKEFEEITKNHKYRNWIYRGQSDCSWGLESSYYRYCDFVGIVLLKNSEVNKNNAEERLISKFKNYASLYLNNLPSENDDIEWLTLMQHHGTPTRLLDWSYSPYVAAYFASDTKSQIKSDFALFCINITKLDKETCASQRIKNLDLAKKSILKYRKKSKSFVFAYEPKFKHSRVVAQQGVFTVPSSNYKSFEVILGEYDVGKICKKIIIPGESRKEWLQKLHSMNINHATLFPGLDGFCSSIRYELIYDSRNHKKKS